jgi:hypothetical protein
MHQPYEVLAKTGRNWMRLVRKAANSDLTRAAGSTNLNAIKGEFRLEKRLPNAEEPHGILMQVLSPNINTTASH